MPTALAEAHIAAQARLRALVAAAVGTAWDELAGYDERNVDEWLATVVPVAQAGQRQSVALTEAFLAGTIGRQALGINADQVAASIRQGATPAEVYRRPFVTLWSALKTGTDFPTALSGARARATSTAATDVQLAMRTTLRDVAAVDDVIVGYQRVPDAGACEFCLLVSGQRYHGEDLMPIHNHCGCGVDVITRTNRHEFTGQAANDRPRSSDGVAVAVRDHGELGPVLVDAGQHFTHL